jgi:hypothetical protein
MECKGCHSDMMVAKSKLTSETGSTDVYSELTMVCINPKCPNYCGINLDNPTTYETIKNKVN